MNAKNKEKNTAVEKDMKKTKNRGKRSYGIMGAAITIIVLVMVMLFNAAFTAIGTKYNFYADMSKEKVYGLSDSTVSILEKLREEKPDTRISIKFCTDADRMEQNDYLKYVYNTAKALDNRFDYISIDFLDIAGDPASFAPYLATSASSVVSTDVIVTCEEQYRICGIRTFFTFSDEDSSKPFAYDGEYKFVSTILQMAYAGQKAYFTEGHGEDTASSALYNLFESAGFECITIDLKSGDFTEGGGVIIVNNPKYDFSADDDTVNEIKKLDRFLDDKGNLMLFTDPQYVSSLENLGEYISEWGVKLTNGKIRDYSHALSVDGYTLSGKYAESGDGSTLHKAMRNLDSSPAVVFEDASPIEIIWDSGSRDARHVSEVFTSYEDSTLIDVNSGNTRDSGQYNIMTVSQEEYVVENQRFYSSVLVTTSAHFTDEKYLNGNAYGNNDILYSVMRICGQSNTPSDIDFKVFDDNSIVMEKSVNTFYTALFCAVIPIIILAAGGAVVIWRKRR